MLGTMICQLSFFIHITCYDARKANELCAVYCVNPKQNHILFYVLLAQCLLKVFVTEFRLTDIGGWLLVCVCFYYLFRNMYTCIIKPNTGTTLDFIDQWINKCQ